MTILDACSRATSEMRAWIRAYDAPSPGLFEDIALRRFALQYESIPAFGALCRARDRIPATVQGWRDIPLVPVAAFKDARLHTEAAARQPAATFETSGTTDGRPGIVRLGSTSTYDAAALATFKHWVLPDGADRFRCIALVPSARIRPHSSLGHMVRLLGEVLGDGRIANPVVAGPDRQGRVDIAALVAALRACREAGRPALILTTTLALGMSMKGWPEALTVGLPPGSRLVDTGGPKGRVAVPPRADQHAFVTSAWGIEPDFIVGELGMTELGSQRYETVLRARFRDGVAAARVYAGPPWLRSVVLDPATLEPVAPGEVGMVGHVDLANIDSCAFMLTADLGRLVGVQGVGVGLEWIGRAPGAELRGCGLDLG